MAANTGRHGTRAYQVAGQGGRHATQLRAKPAMTSPGTMGRT